MKQKGSFMYFNQILLLFINKDLFESIFSVSFWYKKKLQILRQIPTKKEYGMLNHELLEAMWMPFFCSIILIHEIKFMKQ